MRFPLSRRFGAAARLALLAGTLPWLFSPGTSADDAEPGTASPGAPSTVDPPREAEPASSPATAASRLDLVVRPGSSVSYHLEHTLHDVTGVSTKPEGSARLSPGGSVEVLVRARVDSFDSGNTSRDAKMLEVTEASRFPLVEVRAAGTFGPPASYPATLDVVLDGELTFHGLTRPVSVPVRATFTGPVAATATATFPFSLQSFDVVPPSILFLVIKDRAVVTATLVLGVAAP